MRIDAEAAAAFHCPRWAELPAIPLYMDQVVLVMEDAVGMFAEGGRVVTPTMVNNYVKHGVIPAPERKKYTRRHLAALLVTTVMKRVLSMNEIIVLKRAIVNAEGEENAYGLFAARLEETLRTTFAEGGAVAFSAPPTAVGALDAALGALMGKLYVQNYMEASGGE